MGIAILIHIKVPYILNYSVTESELQKCSLKKKLKLKLKKKGSQCKCISLFIYIKVNTSEICLWMRHVFSFKVKKKSNC